MVNQRLFRSSPSFCLQAPHTCGLYHLKVYLYDAWGKFCAQTFHSRTQPHKPGATFEHFQPGLSNTFSAGDCWNCFALCIDAPRPRKSCRARLPRTFHHGGGRGGGRHDHLKSVRQLHDMSGCPGMCTARLHVHKLSTRSCKFHQEADSARPSAATNDVAACSGFDFSSLPRNGNNNRTA